MTYYPRSGEDIDRGLVGYWKLDDKKKGNDGIVGHWKLNDNAANTVVVDATGNNNGVASSNTNTITTVGKINTALNFGTNTELVGLGALDATSYAGLTLSAWVYVTGFGSYHSIIDNEKFVTPNMDGWTFRINQIGTVSFTLSDVISAGGAGKSTITSNTKIVQDTWTHVVATWDGTNMAIYINGVAEIDTDTWTGTIPNHGESTAIGGIRTISNFEGYIDDVRMYNRGLTSSEIAKIYNSGNGDETSYLFNLDNISIDKSNFNDGTITGATSANDPRGRTLSALSFDGTNGTNVVISNNSVFNFSGDFSIAIWVKRDTSGRVETERIFGIYANNDWLFEIENTDKFGLTLFGIVVYGSTSTITDTNWHHIVGVYDDSASTIDLYLDGVLDKAHTGVGAHSSSGNDLFISQSGTPANVAAEGDMANARVYNRKLTSGEVNKLFKLKG